VYVYPGGNQSDVVVLKANGWYKLAEEFGIIIVSVNGRGPISSRTGAVNAYFWGSGTNYDSDMLFMEKLIPYVNANYPTDTSRMFTSGLYNATTYIAMNMPDVFAAQGSASAMGSSVYANEKNAMADLATFQILGENDSGSPVIGNNPPVIVQRLAAKGYTLDDVVRIENIYDKDPRYIINEYYVKGPNGLPRGEPLMRMGWAFNRGHSFLQSDYRIIWEEWFRYWKLEADGTHTWSGHEPWELTGR
jgi:hypothetical protein